MKPSISPRIYTPRPPRRRPTAQAWAIGALILFVLYHLI